MRFFGRERPKVELEERQIAELLLSSIIGEPAASSELERRLLFMSGAEIMALEDSKPSSSIEQRLALSHLRYANAPWPAVALLSHHRSGYVREAAVKAARRLGPRLVPFLIGRVNDWVPAVAQLAQAYVLANLPSVTRAILERAIPPLCRVHRSTRNDLGAFWSNVEAELAKWPDVLEQVSVSRQDDRWLQDVALRSPAARYERGLQHVDPVVRLRFARAAVGAYTGAEREKLIERLTKDRSPRVRLLALDHAVGDEHVLRRFALDPNWYLRAAARHALRKLEVTIDADFYKAQSRSPGSIAGVGDVGGKDDVPFLLDALDDKHVDIRRNAVRSLGRIGGDDARTAVKEAIFDSSVKVGREAIDTLRELNGLIHANDVDRLFGMPGHESVAVRAAAWLNRWRTFAVLLEASRSSSRAVPAIQRWLSMSRSAGIPSRPDAEAIDRIAREGLAHLPADMQEALNYEIAFARKALEP